ncbi:MULTISPECIES: phage holin [unclassified Bacillus (in: firmicutes)]
MGIVQDPTIKGIGDSRQALTYEVPRDDKPDVYVPLGFLCS